MLKKEIIADVTKAKGRKRLYHFTRVKNLSVISQFDSLYSSQLLYPQSNAERRTAPKEVGFRNQNVIVNAHLRIPDQMIDASYTQEQFRACLNGHVFFWPTIRDCRKMIETYAKREKNEAFAVLEFDAPAFLQEHYADIKITKYDSGSSPRYPQKCLYRKSPNMFLPLTLFKSKMCSLVPVKSSEIKEVLVENHASCISKHLLAVYTEDFRHIPSCWSKRGKPWSELWNEVGQNKRTGSVESEFF
ncbi:hypothetical protein FHS16_001785 [Paenibacillus endophyticus]|uniref:DUF4433 domain-containing protein n=1 Tax=Paenibacillus endophyticus TaxID=1294268 RepID=A0A7W5C6U3_9BACL|nr:hypothetical protein [Paenibacillus endophyticus]MBB3151739.1 hypothetical protein [Paenibacillus endophyticus]